MLFSVSCLVIAPIILYFISATTALIALRKNTGDSIPYEACKLLTSPHLYTTSPHLSHSSIFLSCANTRKKNVHELDYVTTFVLPSCDTALAWSSTLPTDSLSVSHTNKIIYLDQLATPSNTKRPILQRSNRSQNTLLSSSLSTSASCLIRRHTLSKSTPTTTTTSTCLLLGNRQSATAGGADRHGMTSDDRRGWGEYRRIASRVTERDSEDGSQYDCLSMMSRCLKLTRLYHMKKHVFRRRRWKRLVYGIGSANEDVEPFDDPPADEMYIGKYRVVWTIRNFTEKLRWRYREMNAPPLKTSKIANTHPRTHAHTHTTQPLLAAFVNVPSRQKTVEGVGERSCVVVFIDDEATVAAVWPSIRIP
eukprot:GHVQ01021676.1.p1 GENE.GHVQ01021676.1~~GHVQ01021676.1.p1  ORF type:complete len:364 (-),score=54.82 GHVQ01021676.1:1902-2993(-)